MISLCIISRKEDEEGLRKAIRSVMDHVDEIIIVDTSTGKEKLEYNFHQPDGYRYHKMVADKGSKAKIIPFKWTGSFADARNFSFEKATHDVIFWVDSDDIVVNPELLPKLAKKVEDGTADWVFSEYIYSKDEFGNILARHWKVRLIKKGSGHWVGRVHEDLVPDRAVVQEKDVDLGAGRLVIEHKADKDHFDVSAERNLAIQLQEIADDGENVDPRTIMYTAMSLQSLNRFEEALPHFARHIKVSGSKEDKYWSYYRIALCLIFMNKPEEAIIPLLESLTLFPEWQSSYFLIARAYSDLEKWDKVIEWTLTGKSKDRPDTLQVLSDLDYTLLPMGRLALAYLHTGLFNEALEIAQDMVKINPEFKDSKELLEMCEESVRLEKFVESFLTVANEFRKNDRVKAAKLFDLIPSELDDDIRIQAAHGMMVPPMKWSTKSVVIYCGKSLEEWAYPSIFTGIGGSEEAVINMAKELTSKGYEVTVFNRCGDLKGNYDGVEYRPYYHFNPKDIFNVLIGWRQPSMFVRKYNAKKKYLWLHDIAYPEQFNEKIYENVDKILFLSNWHRNNLPDLPDEKVFITNNGINPADFKNLPEKRPNSLIWSSSYDRGLLPFIKNILPLIKKEIPNVTLDVAYGWQNIEKEMDQLPHLRELYNELSPILENTPGITHHGRLSHKKLSDLMGSSMVYPYASEFGETNNITSQKCQRANCYVVTTSQAGGTPERVHFGKVVPASSIYTDKKEQKEFATEVVRYFGSAPIQALNHANNGFSFIGDPMFAWSTTANQWIKELL